MSGSILSKDQIEKINAAYPKVCKHIRELFNADNSPYGLMKVHVATEYIDSTELFKLFSPLSFLSPIEKKALVRAAIYTVLAQPEMLTVVTEIVADPVLEEAKKTEPIGFATPAPSFTPPRFIATTESLHTEEV